MSMYNKSEKLNNIDKDIDTQKSENNIISPDKLNSLCAESESEINLLSSSLLDQAQEILSQFPEINNFPESESLLEIKQEVLDLQKETNDSITWVKQRFNLDKSYKESFAEMEIQGSNEFREKIINSLRFLSLAPEKLNFVQENIKRIQEWGHSGMNVFKDKPTFEIGDTWKEADEIYLASGIAHDAYHAYLCENSQDGEGNISLKAFTGKEAEKKCLAFQIETLNEIKNSDYLKNFKDGQKPIEHQIDNLKKLMINPTYQDIPYEERNW